MWGCAKQSIIAISMHTSLASSPAATAAAGASWAKLLCMSKPFNSPPLSLHPRLAASSNWCTTLLRAIIIIPIREARILWQVFSIYLWQRGGGGEGWGGDGTIKMMMNRLRQSINQQSFAESFRSLRRIFHSFFYPTTTVYMSRYVLLGIYLLKPRCFF